MLHRAIDLIACPADKSALRLKAGYGSKERKVPAIIPAPCREFCSFLGRDVADCTSTPCADCGKVEITDATLVCSKCGDFFEVEDGIARTLQLSEDGHDADRKVVAIKKSEIEIRDRQSSSFDGKYSPAYTEIENSAVLSRMDAPCGEIIVDLACGTGRFSGHMVNRCGELLCLDFSIESLRVLSQKLQGSQTPFHLIQADMNHLPLRQTRFPVIYCGNALMHLPTPAARTEALKQISACLSDDGLLVATVYNHTRRTPTTRQKEGFHNDRLYFYRYDHDEFEEYLGEVFSVEEVAGLINLPVHRVSGLLFRLGLGRVARAMERIIEKTPLSFFLGETLLGKCRKRQE